MIYRICDNTGKQMPYKWINFSDKTCNVELDTQVADMFDQVDTLTITVSPLGNTESMDTVPMRLMMLVDALRHTLGNEPRINLYLDYLPNARADRRFLSTNSVPLSIFIDLIHRCRFNKVYVELPHNAAALHSSWVVVERSVVHEMLTHPMNSHDVLVFPDKGAADRFSKYSSGWPVVFEKKRDVNTGKVVGMQIISGPSTKEPGTTFLILDDICDGGRTFIECAQVLLDTFPGCKVKLAVAHGIFSKGLEVFDGLLDSVYTRNIVGDYVTMQDIINFNARGALL